jgi:hypothetical protein
MMEYWVKKPHFVTQLSNTYSILPSKIPACFGEAFVWKKHELLQIEIMVDGCHTVVIY